MNALEDKQTSGLPLAIGAYAIWGVVPLYFRGLSQVPPFEMVCWRVVLTLPLCLIIIAFRRQGPDLLAALRNRPVVARLCASALLIAANWVLYIWAVIHGHVLAASLGYYINPLVSVLLGTVFLKERLNPRQWTAVAIAATGIAVLAAGSLDMLGIALSLAFSFGGYGFVRKVTPVGSVPGLAIETLLLLVPALAVLGWYASGPAGSGLTIAPSVTVLLLCAGFVTATPLLMFAVAARRLDLSTLGFVQFVSPTTSFLLGVLVFREQLSADRLACFVLIWTAIALFSWDLLARRRMARSTG